MESMVKKTIQILNLAGELAPEFTHYFAQKEIMIIEPESFSDQALTHILTKDRNDFSQITSDYDVSQKDIKIVSLGRVDDLQHFVSSNGKLIFDELWLGSELGPFILDKFFQEYGGVSLNDNYPTFQERGSFNITNPFNTGEYLDRLVQSAFTDGLSALSIKTFFDHLVMYLTTLKAKGKIGMPIEVTYGYFKDVFGVQLHFYTQNLILEDVTSSLSNQISKKADKYLLNVAIEASDFLDFTVLKEVNKTVVTALWTKDERIQSENRGFLFNELSASAAVTNYPSEGVTSFLAETSIIPDFTEEYSQTIKGSASEKEFSQKISGSTVEEDIINLVKGSLEDEEEKVFRISGSDKFDVDDFVFKVSAGIVDKAKKDDNLKVRSLGQELPEAIKSSFQVFATQLNKSVEDINEMELKTFREQEVPNLIRIVSKKVDEEKPQAKPIDLKASTLAVENDSLKTKMKALMSEVKILKESKAQMLEIHKKAKAAAEASIQTVSSNGADELLRSQMMQKMLEQKTLSEQDIAKLSALLERENKLLGAAKEAEMNLKKLQLETIQKESVYGQELEKLNRSVKSKELIVLKTKEGLTKLVEQKDNELRLANEKLAVATKAMNSNQSQNQANQIRELERKVINHEKMIEIYKTKMTEKPLAKSEDDGAKEENRKLLMINTQMKNQVEAGRKDILKFQEKLAQETQAYNALKGDKVNLEQLLKKTMMDAKKDETAVAQNAQQDVEFKRLKAQYDLLEIQMKDFQTKSRDLEVKLQDALKNQKKDVASEDTNSKGKMAHLENNVRKLTQDLGASLNQQAEMKKETNKLRQEKIALQNQLDKMKKEAEKAKPAAPKKPGMGGKAA